MATMSVGPFGTQSSDTAEKGQGAVNDLILFTKP